MFIVNSYQFGGGVVPSIDPDAQAFLTAAAITDPTITSAIDTLVVQLKADSIWTKMKALYPFVGGTATTHKWNLKDPQDLDAAFRLTFSGGWTHSANGATPNGTNGYANTYLIPSTSLTTSSAHFSKYNRTNDLVGNKVDGVWVNTTVLFLQQNYSLANSVIGNVASIVSYTPSDTRGLFTTTRTANNVVKAFKNTTQLGTTNTSLITNLPAANVYLGARNRYNTTGELYNSYQCAFSSIGDGLTDTDTSNLYTAVQAFQTSLSRQV
jgi:hypothetical protein